MGISEDDLWGELCEHEKCACCCLICNDYEPSEPENIEDQIAKGWQISSDRVMKEGYTYTYTYTYKWLRVK